jgi:hypothetical protein
MLFLALALQIAGVPHYDDLPHPTKQSVASCAASYDRLQAFVSDFKSSVFRRELGHGGRLMWSQANKLRYAADLSARPYLEGIRQIAFKGDVQGCRAIAVEGEQKIINDIILPVFGRR